MKINNGDMPAMPGFIQTDFTPGLTKREYFAGLALQGIAADPDFSGDAEDAATIACDYADELLAKLGSTK